MLGTNSVYLQTGSDVLSGDVMVNQSGTGPFLNGSVELSVAGTVTTAAGYDVAGNRINLASGAVVNGDAFYNTLTGTGSINGGQTSSVALPIFSSPAGVPDRHAGDHQRHGRQQRHPDPRGRQLPRPGGGPEGHRHLHRRHLPLPLDPDRPRGQADLQRRLSGPGPTKLSTGILTTIGPATGASFDASSLIFYIGGANGTTGGLAETPKAVEIGTDNVLKANVYAPNGTLWLKDRTQATGAFIAKDMLMGPDAQVTLDSFYVGQ